MTVARMKGIGKKIKKKVKKWLPEVFPPSSKIPGQMDFPAIPAALKRKKKAGKSSNSTSTS